MFNEMHTNMLPASFQKDLNFYDGSKDLSAINPNYFAFTNELLQLYFIS